MLRNLAAGPRMAPTTLRVGVLAAVSSLVLAVSLAGSQPAFAQARTPELALKDFVADINAGKPSCSLLVADLRDEFTYPLLDPLDPLSPQSWSATGQTKLCNAWIFLFNVGIPWDEDTREWKRTTLSRIVVAERTDTVVHLSVHAKHYFTSRRDNRDQQINVWMQLEDGAWKLASLNQLVQFESDPAPDTLARWVRYRDRLTRSAAALRAELARQTQAALAATAIVAAAPLACRGRSSRVTDAARDVNWAAFPKRVRNQRAPTIDMTSAALRSSAGGLCWQIGFARPPGPRFRLAIDLFGGPATAPSARYQLVDISVKDGKAFASTKNPSDKPVLVPLEISRTGRMIRFKIVGRDLHGSVNTLRPFRWALHSYEGRLSSEWTDEIDDGVHRP